MSAASWYRDGLCFTCTRCGNCCRGFPGTVRVDDAEIAALAARLELQVQEFRDRYTRVMPEGFVSLTEKPDYDCVFWDRDHGCLVYEQRPTQCRTWPFWRGNLVSPEAWEEQAQGCPGMNSGRLHGLDEIEDRAAKTS